MILVHDCLPLTGLFDKAKRKLLKKEDEELPVAIFGSDGSGVASGVAGVSVSETVAWDPQELGMSHNKLRLITKEVHLSFCEDNY